MYYKLSHHTTSDVTPTHSIHVHISAGPDTIYSSLPFLHLPMLIVERVRKKEGEVRRAKVRDAVSNAAKVLAEDS